MTDIIDSNNAFDGFTTTSQSNNDMLIHIAKLVENELVPKINEYYGFMNKYEKYTIQLKKIRMSDKTINSNKQIYAILINAIIQLEEIYRKLAVKFNNGNTGYVLSKPKKNTVQKNFDYSSPRDLGENIKYTLNEVQRLSDNEDIFMRAEELLDSQGEM